MTRSAMDAQAGKFVFEETTLEVSPAWMVDEEGSCHCGEWTLVNGSPGSHLHLEERRIRASCASRVSSRKIIRKIRRKCRWMTKTGEIPMGFRQPPACCSGACGCADPSVAAIVLAMAIYTLLGVCGALADSQDGPDCLLGLVLVVGIEPDPGSAIVSQFHQLLLQLPLQLLSSSSWRLVNHLGRVYGLEGAATGVPSCCSTALHTPRWRRACGGLQHVGLPATQRAGAAAVVSRHLDGAAAPYGGGHPIDAVVLQRRARHLCSAVKH